jgi:hypothetical protein
VKDTTSIVKEIDLKEANISLRSDGIVYVFFKENCVLNVELQLRMLAAYKEITGDKMTPFLFLADKGVTLTKEARDNAITIESISPCAASAVVVTNLAYKLIASFYMQFNKPLRPYKVFSNKGEAAEWLKKYMT